MEYNQLLSSVKQLNFIENEQMADAAIKATFGILVSSIPENSARELTRSLPDPLTFEKLRSHQESTNDVSPRDHIQQIATQFNLPENQAEELVSRVFSAARSGSSEQQSNWEQKLPGEWSSFVKKFDR